MNKRIIFIADFFVEHILGGGELNNEELVKLLEETGYEVEKVQSHVVDLALLKREIDNFFIISNFINLSYDCRSLLSSRANYIIYEHDHKYLSSRNPSDYRDFKAPTRELRNYFFYKKARKVVCQSDFHKQIVEKNLDIENIISVGGNLWSTKTLNILRKIAQESKTPKCSIMRSSISHKNTQKARDYCESQNLEYDLVEDSDPIKFLKKLGKNKTFVFFPGTPETLSRVITEARMMGMSIKTNALVGAAQEKWFSLKGEKLIDLMVEKRKEILRLFIEEINCVAEHPPPQKKISIITTFYKGDDFLDGFLDNITEQTIFDDCELIIVDTGSRGNEKKIISSYARRYNNIKYFRHEDRLKPTVGLNLALKEVTGKYITFAFLDDRKSLDCLESLLSELEGNTKVDLVYGDCLLTDIKNETFDESAATELFDHSTREFSRENMIKCLPGPMPMWRASIHEKNGFIDQESCDFADDWEMRLRAVSEGSQFKKVDKTVGLCLQGGRSQQTHNVAQRREEAQIFYKYWHVFGKNFGTFKTYFDQFLN